MSGEARERAQKMLDFVGLGQMADRSPDRLSDGQQQRVALARAMVYHPMLLFFDQGVYRKCRHVPELCART